MRIVRLKLVLVAAVVSLAALAHAPAALAACAANTANLGQVTGNFTISTAGTYRVWSRISVPSATSGYTLEVDDAAPNCAITVGGGNVTSLNTWTWVDFRDGNIASKINMTLSAGPHTYKLYGRDANVKLDRVVFSQSCTSTAPAGTGDNCLTVPDTTAPSAPTNLTAPSKTTTQITLGWTAANDNVSVASYKVYRNGTAVKTVAAPAVTYTDTGLTAATNYSYQVSAVDTSGNEGAKSTPALSVNTNIATPPADTVAPSVPTGLAVTNKSATNVAIKWTASTDNSGTVSGYKIFRGGTLIQTVAVQPWLTTTSA